MNYAAIYERFISDRRLKEAALIGTGAYVEKHHIRPRSLGGTDAKRNLIRLTPEDHFFAHLLLAKIHGGRLWAPVAFMVGGDRRDWSPRRSRLSYGWAAREMARAFRGEGSHQFDWTVYELEHDDGRRWSGKQSEMPEALGCSRAMANLLIKRKVGSAKGWFHVGERPRSIGMGGMSRVDHPMTDRRTFHFRHVDGREFKGTQSELQKQHGVSQAGASGIVTGQRRVSAGWYLDGKPPHPVGRGAKLRDETGALIGSTRKRIAA